MKGFIAGQLLKNSKNVQWCVSGFRVKYNPITNSWDTFILFTDPDIPHNQSNPSHEVLLETAVAEFFPDKK